jgi:hypothetical protein
MSYFVTVKINGILANSRTLEIRYFDRFWPSYFNMWVVTTEKSSWYVRDVTGSTQADSLITELGQSQPMGRSRKI